MKCLQALRSPAIYSLAWHTRPLELSASRQTCGRTDNGELAIEPPSMHLGLCLRASRMLLKRSSAGWTRPGRTLSKPICAATTTASIQAPVVYYGRMPQEENAFIRLLPPGQKLSEGEAPSHAPSRDPKEMTICDVRSASSLPTLEVSGFQLLSFPEPPNIDWSDDEQVREGSRKLKAARHSFYTDHSPHGPQAVTTTAERRSGNTITP